MQRAKTAVVAMMLGCVSGAAADEKSSMPTMFTVKIENIAPAGAIRTSAGTAVDVVLAPGAWAVHAQPGALFSNTSAARHPGLEAAAEDGDPAMLVKTAAAMAKALTETQAQMKDAAAKMSDAAKKDAEPKDAKCEKAGMVAAGAFSARSGGGSGVVRPGQAYEFTISAAAGQRLSFVSMYVQSNDSFLGSTAEGIALFDEQGLPIRGDVTSQVLLWDAGTEVNEPLGAGPSQGARQRGHNVGADENGVVRPVEKTAGFPSVAETFRVTVTPVTMQ